MDLRCLLVRRLAAVSLVACLSMPVQAQVFYNFHIQWVETHSVERLTDLNPGPSDSMDRWFTSTQLPHYMIAYDGALYFRASDGSTGKELWRFDGNAVSLVSDIMPGPAGSDPEWFAVYDNDLYFTASTAKAGTELMRYDGSAVTIAADIAPTAGLSSHPGSKAVFDGALYFGANAGTVGYELYRFDGNAASLAVNINNEPGTNHIGLKACCIEFDGRLYFSGDDGNGQEPWSYDGTTGQKAVDIGSTGGSGPFWDGMHAIVYQGALYFPAVDTLLDNGHGYELWRFDGTTATMVADLMPGSASSYPNSFAIHQGGLYFRANDPQFGAEVRRYDGSTISVPVDVIPGKAGPGGTNLISYGSAPNALYFAGNTASTNNREVLRISASSFKVAADVNQTSGGGYHASSSFPEDFTELDGYLYFTADDGIHGRELWRLKAQRHLEVYGEVGRFFDKWWEWPIDPYMPAGRDVVLVLYAAPLRGSPTLVGRLQTRESELVDDRRAKLFEVDLDAMKLPQSFALVMVGFDTASGRRLGHGIEIYGDMPEDLAESLRRRSEAFATKLGFDEVGKAGASRGR